MRITLLEFSLLLSLLFFAFSCENREAAFQAQPELLSFEQFEVYGEVHNQFMTNVKENFSA